MRERRRHKRLRGSIGRVLAYAFLVTISAVALFPLIWGFLSSLKDEHAIIAYPPQLFPSSVTFIHYQGVLFQTSMPRFFMNSLFVTLSSVLLTTFVAFHSAYAVARFSFRGKAILMFGILSTAMIPGISILIPLYLVAKRVGLYDSYLALILVYSSWQAPLTLWLLRGFVEAVPRELEEAAALDGCSRFGVIYRIVLPLMRPGLVAAAIMIFVYVWNDFLIGVSLTSSEEHRLLQVGLYRYYSDTTGILWGRFIAYTMLASLPIIAAFSGLRRRFIEGMVRGSLKG